jgi:uncharacterized protein involved in tolerance to divalent cations
MISTYEGHMADCLQVITTIDTREHADVIGQKLLEKRLAVCVQTEGPTSSSYFGGKVR